MAEAITAAAPVTKKPLLYKVGLAWAGLATIIPAVISVFLITNPGKVMTPGVQVEQVMRGMGYRNIAFSLVLAAAIFTQPGRVIGFVLAARGLTELADGLSGIFVQGGNGFVPFLGPAGD